MIEFVRVRKTGKAERSARISFATRELLWRVLNRQAPGASQSAVRGRSDRHPRGVASGRRRRQGGAQRRKCPSERRCARTAQRMVEWSFRSRPSESSSCFRPRNIRRRGSRVRFPGKSLIDPLPVRGSGGRRAQLETVRTEACEVADVGRGKRGIRTNGGGGQQAIGERPFPTAGLIEEARQAG